MTWRLNGQGQLVDDQASGLGFRGASGSGGGFGLEPPSGFMGGSPNPSTSGPSGIGSYTPADFSSWGQNPVAGNASGPGSQTPGFGGLEGLKLGIGGIATLGNLWNAFQSQKLAKEQFSFQRDFANQNLGNQIQSYNTTLEDRARSRGAQEGQSQEQVQSYVDKNRLNR